MRAFRKRAAPTALLALLATWHGALRPDLLRAQSSEHGGELVPASQGPGSAAGAAAEGAYDREALDSLGEHLESVPGGAAPEPGSPPPEPAEVARALAALPGGEGVSAQATALPDGAATQLGMGESFTTQLSTGTVGYTIPLTLPSARGGVQPRLDLSYSSSGGFGLAGVGWSFGGTAISRQIDRGPPKYDDRDAWHPEQDRFVFGGMELVPICTVSGTSCSGALAGEAMPVWASGWHYFRARIESAFLRFFWSPDHRTWRVQATDGSSMEFGVPLDGSNDVGALERNPDEPGQIFRWYLVRQYDSRGGANDPGIPQPVNKIVYRYLQDGGALYLSDIFDTTPVSSPTTSNLALLAHHTRLVYEARPDVAASYRQGWYTEHALRIARVDVTSKPWSGTSAARELVRRYHFEYEQGAHRSLLTAVQAEGRCAAPVYEQGADQALPLTSCPRLPAMRFEYQRAPTGAQPLEDSQGNAFEPFNETVQALASSPPHSLDEEAAELADVNADGLPDVLVTAGGRYGGRHGLYLGGLDPQGARGFGWLSTMAVEPAADAVDANVLRLGNQTVSALDLDGDGIINLVHMPAARRYGVFWPVADVAGSGSYQFEWRGRALTTASNQDVKIDFTSDAADVRVIDVNGDGLVDFVYSSPTELQTFFALGRYPGGDDQFGHAVWTSDRTAAISNDPVRSCAPWSSTPVRFSDPDVQIADMNGDGLDDLVRLRSGQVLYWPGRGNGVFGTGARDDCPGGTFGVDRHVEMHGAPHFGTSRVLMLSDVSGDGLSDLVEVRNQGIDIYLNDNGLGWTQRHIIDDTPFLSAGSNHVRLTDIDGSGTPDVLWGAAHDYRYIDLTGGVTPHLLTHIHNGLGKTIELDYESSTDHMLAAQAAGRRWDRGAPTALPVLVRSTVRDNLERIARPGGIYVTEYEYSDPVYDGRQREFRGFREAIVSVLGDANSPTGSARSVFLLGECLEGGNPSSIDLCNPEARWQDNPREALKGLPVLSESFDASGVHVATEHTTYTLRQLYTGRDGRRVVTAAPTAKDAFAYDTASFDRVESVVPLDEVVLQISDDEGEPITGIERRNVTVRASAGTARISSQTSYDDFGNTLTSVRRGCVSGCATGPTADEVVTATSVFARPSGDGSGWLFREQRSYVQGSVYTAIRRDITHSYDARGQLLQTFGQLGGTLDLDRSHSGGGAIAPLPAGRSGGVASPVLVTLSTNTYDQFGQLTFARGPNGRCGSTEFDTDYGQLPITARLYSGPVDTGTNCGTRQFVRRVTFDRGLEAPLTATDQAGQPSSVGYDTFGRLVSVFNADPATPGQLAALPTLRVQYTLPSDDTTTPYSRTIVQTQDGATPNVDSYVSRWSYVDGLGRPLLSLDQADPTAGDGGAWVVAGETTYDAKGAVARQYDPWFYTGDPDVLARNFASLWPGGPFASQEYDAFSRETWSYDVGIPQKRVIHHALSVDTYDAADLENGGEHAGTLMTAISNGHGRAVERIDRIKVGAALEQRRTINEFLPSGELARATLRKAGSPDVVRWMRYDTLGRMVLNVEPNTTSGFNPDPNTPPSQFRALRLAYNDAGDLVGTSDARGCGSNFWYDAGGRIVAEDRSPCVSTQAAYSPPNIASGDGTEAFYHYDELDPTAGTIVDAGGQTLTINGALLWGRLASVSSLASKTVFRYDSLGRATGGAVRVTRPGTPSATLSTRYAPRWYVTTQTLDAANRPLVATTGMPVPELRGDDGTSELRYSYTKRGLARRIDSSYGVLLSSSTHRADGLATQYRLGDAAATQREFQYDVHKRVRLTQTYRANAPLWSNPPPGSDYVPPTPAEDPTLQLLLESTEFVEYDPVGNPLEIADTRVVTDWPAGSKPVTRTFRYDDLYRLVSATFTHEGGPTDSWTSPFAAENADAARVQPNPHVSFTNRVTTQAWSYDWLGNIAQSTDDQQAFWDRSGGDRVHGSPTAGPHRIGSASNRTLAPASTRKGDLSVDYDPAGHMRGLVVRRDGPCLPTGASCWQRFDYEWNEVGELSRARRWDLRTTPTNERVANDAFSEPLPARAPDAELRFHYDQGGRRMLKTAVDALGATRHTVYVNDALELRSAAWNGTDYALDVTTASLRLSAGPASARVIYALQDLPSISTAHRHVFLELSDYLGSGTVTIDHATGELVELTTYQPYGATDSDYRPGRWARFREPFKFTGKEEDIELGLAYFGARYYSPYLETWLSPDPATIHGLQGDANPYAYVHGRPSAAVDPDGQLAFLVVIVVAAVIAGIVNASIQLANNGGKLSRVDWGIKGVAGAMIVGAVGAAVGGPLAGVIGGAAGAFIGGAVGGAAAYSAGAAIGAYEFSAVGFASSVAGGAYGGVAGMGGGFEGAMGGAMSGATASFIVTSGMTGTARLDEFALSIGVGVASAVASQGLNEAMGASAEGAALKAASSEPDPAAFNKVLAGGDGGAQQLEQAFAAFGGAGQQAQRGPAGGARNPRYNYWYWGPGMGNNAQRPFRIPWGPQLPRGHRGFDSHNEFVKAFGRAGWKMEWHHIVEQTPGNVARFGATTIHNTRNYTKVRDYEHHWINAFYNSNVGTLTGNPNLNFTVRQWLSTQSYQQQYSFGIRVLNMYRIALQPPPVWSPPPPMIGPQ